MSMKGIKFFAKQLENLQEARQELFKMGTQPKAIDNQDIKLAQLCSKMNDAVKKEFCEITVE